MDQLNQSVKGLAVLTLLAAVNTFALSWLGWIEGFTWENTVAVLWLSLFASVMIYMVNKATQPVFILDGELVDPVTVIEEDEEK